MEKLRIVDKSKESAEKRPTWHIAEQFSEARSEARGSEDALLITDHCIAVFDGVSTPGDPRAADGRTPAQHAVEVGLKTLKDNPGLMAEDAAASMSAALRAYASERVLPGRPSFVFAAFFPKQNRIVRVGDCPFLIDGVGHNPGIPPDRAKAILRKRIIEEALRTGKTPEEIVANDPAHDRMKSLREWQGAFTNNAGSPDLGYGVVDGTKIPEHFVEYVSVPIDATSIILATDGYPASVLRGTLAETEEALRTLEKSDPLGISEELSVRPIQPHDGQPAADDRTYVRVQRD